MVTLELAKVALLLDELGVMVPAVEPSLMGYIVRRAYCASSMSTLEAALVVRSSIHRDLILMY